MAQTPATVFLVTIADIVAADREVTESLRLVCRELARWTTAETVAAYLLDAEGRLLYPAAAYHVPKDMLDVLAQIRLPVAEQGFNETVFGGGQVAWTDDVAADTRFAFHLFRRFPHQSGAVIPLLRPGAVVGAFYLAWWGERRTLTEPEATTLQAVGRQVALLLRSAALLQEAERRRADAQAAEGRYRGLFEQVPVGVLRTLPGGAIVDANPAMAAMLGYPDAAALKALVVQSLYMELADRTRFKETILRHGVVRNLDVAFRRRDGTPVWVRINTRVVERDGQVQYEGIIQDVSDLRRAEAAERAAEALAYVAKLANAAAHEINNPLAVVMARLELLQRGAVDAETMQKIEGAMVAARRIADVVSYMGRMSRLEERPGVPGSPMLDLRRSGETPREG